MNNYRHYKYCTNSVQQLQVFYFFMGLVWRCHCWMSSVCYLSVAGVTTWMVSAALMSHFLKILYIQYRLVMWCLNNVAAVVVGNGFKLTFQSRSSVVYLDFCSDEYISERGFLVEFNAIQPPSDSGKIQRIFLCSNQLFMLLFWNTVL